MRSLLTALLLVCALTAGAPAGAAGPAERLVDVGGKWDALFVGPGFYQAERPYPPAKHAFHRSCTFRWFANRWTLSIPTFARCDNDVVLRLWTERALKLRIGAGFEATIAGAGDERDEYRLRLPQAAVGDREHIEIHGAVEPPFTAAPDARDKRLLAGALDWVRVTPADPAAPVHVTAQGPPPGGPPAAPEHFVNIGIPGDEPFIVDGAYAREGFNPKSKHPFFRWCSFRWFAGAWTLKLPVFPGRHQEIVFRMMSGRAVQVSVGDNFRRLLLPARGPPYRARLLVPAGVVGNGAEIRLAGSVRSYRRNPNSRDKRELAMAMDWIRIRPVTDEEKETVEMMEIPEEKEADLPLACRLRGTEARPLWGDVDDYVFYARLMRCNVMTIGPMNGRHFTAFPTEHGIPGAKLQPDFIPNQIKALHEWGIAAIGWLPFNVQDLRAPDQCEAARKHPQWTMRYIDWPERAGKERVGMCVVSSPWREMHAGILKEAAALGLDGVFFDGFYLGGIPHPLAAGCVCDHCRAKFKRETGLETPTAVDWTDPAFKRWVRWRNHKLIETAVFFQDKMREANPGLAVTCNYNMWPFGSKDWDTAIPMWSNPGFGVSQHGYTGRLDLEWIMMGFKSRLSHDLNPSHSDVWRTSRPAWRYDGTPDDAARHELTMRTFMLCALAYGTTPWHGGHIDPPEIGIRVHEAVKQRERFFSPDEFRHIGVVVSQNTHDFYGHIPGTSNLEDYRDAVLGAWLLLTERHLPFRFVFDNQIENAELDDYRLLLLPNTACLSDAMVGRLREFAAKGGRIVATAESGAYDEWGEKRRENALDPVPGLTRLPGSPALEWLRQRRPESERALIEAASAAPPPFVVEAPQSLSVTASWGPQRRRLLLHLLNVSAFYPLGDTGFRGMGEQPVYAGDVASDAQILEGGKVKRVNVPARNVVVRTPGLKVKSAALGVSGSPIAREPGGHWVLPEIDVHDVLVLELDETE